MSENAKANIAAEAATEELFKDAEQPRTPSRSSRRRAGDATVSAAAAAAATEPVRRRRATRTIKSLTGSLEAQTEEGRLNEAWKKILTSLRHKQILRGTVSGLEIWNKMPCAIVIFEGVKILIPAKEFLLELPPGEDLNEKSPTFLRKTYSYMDNRLGSEIEFIIAGFVDKADQIVAGSRKNAMKIRQREYFMRKTRDGSDYLLNEGSKVEVRVASAMRFGLVVEVGGIDVLVPSNEVSWARKSDISGDYFAGQKLVAVVTKIDRSDLENIDVSVSIKRAKTDPFEKAQKMLNSERSSKYLGEVTMVDKTGIYVQLEDEIEVVCRPPRDSKMNIPVGARVAVRIYEINEQYRTVRGDIVWNGGVHSV